MNISTAAEFVLKAAEEEAKSFGVSYVVPDCLLLGILSVDCPSAAILKLHGVTAELVRPLIQEIFDFDSSAYRPDDEICPLPLTSWLLREAQDCAQATGANAVTPEHLLAILLQAPGSLDSIFSELQTDRAAVAFNLCPYLQLEPDIDSIRSRFTDNEI
jgi:ATP-dependent Clp protease ATP-binding subunit ClpA